MVAARFGFTVPFSCAEVSASALTAVVVTVGAAGVVKLPTAPTPVPRPLLAIAHTKYVVSGVRPEIVWLYATAVRPAPRLAPPINPRRLRPESGGRWAAAPTV